MGWTLLLALGVAAAFAVVLRRLNFLEQELRRVESLLARLDRREGEPTSVRKMAAAVSIAAPPPVALAPPEPPPAPPAPAQPRFSLESLIGGRLPIWIGGAALVLAGFFLVRYSIDSGLIGPGARTALAALFALALIAASETARRLPATASDPRVAQALAGAGIASLYATLYLAAALYHLIAPLPAFFAVLAVTAIALGLSLRHGPPTAVMALLGGFMAPLVAGFDAAGVGPLLVYLALLVAALFGLAVHRGWGWLALAASAAGFGWVNFLIFARTGNIGDLSAVGAFTMALAAGSSAALPATGLRNPWLRLAPLLAGFVQIIALAPALDFDPLAWCFYLVLSAAALFLAWRDPVYLPAAPASAALLLLLEALALLQPETAATPIAAIFATAIFAIPGHFLAARGRGWAAVALLGTAGSLLITHAAAPFLLADWTWGLLELAAATATASLAWRLRAGGDVAQLTAATALTGFLAALGMAQFAPFEWLAIPLVLMMAALAAWARHVRAGPLFELPAYPFIAALVAAGWPLAQLANLVLSSLSGERLPYNLLPDLADLMRLLALPTILALVLLADPRQYHRVRRFIGAVAATVGVLLLYALAKQPLAIATPERFLSLGFIERALLTQACLATGWLLLTRTRLHALGKALLILGLARLAWFDLLLLNPAIEPQSVGAIPLLNAATIHAALAAFWLWTLPSSRATRVGAAALTLVAVVATIRQLAHGNLLTGPIGTVENTGYSAALLSVSLFWLWRGIAAARHDLRVAGLALLTVVTFKVFLIDASALDGVLRILSFLGLGLALIGIGWAYNRFLGKNAAT
ncbi:MAG: DUF2339 domain-containing protein [Sphingomonas sp.]|uniref:DUF2339 domain-containing protein n=1 Tax=Sphingomonas sp. TaxID=28214 RepID=UPI0025D566B1|nr:DUF2339 domain-containing protein [Sphingomonas sp.]MBX3563097.1 DUF2339 domain-containing protein [Sphingomonas sp.]